VIEFVDPLDRERLAVLLTRRGVDPTAYSLSGGHPSECYVLDHRGYEWVVYYSERGLETGVEGSFICTPSHDQRPRFCPPLSFARGCDPCRPGTAVQVERPQRSEDERPGRSAVSGTAWRRPPRSRNVTDRTPADAPEPPIGARHLARAGSSGPAPICDSGV